MSACDGRDGCRAVVMRAYRELRQRGVPDANSFNAAVAVYRDRHPEAASKDAVDAVADWIADGLGQ